MSELKKVDYRELSENKKLSNSQKGQELSEQKKGFSLTHFTNFWLLADKKIKLEIIIFAVIILAIIGLLLFHLSQRPQKVAVPLGEYELPEEQMP